MDEQWKNIADQLESVQRLAKEEEGGVRGSQKVSSSSEQTGNIQHTSIYFPAEIVTALKILGKQQGMSMSALVVSLARNYVSKNIRNGNLQKFLDNLKE